MSLHKCLTIFIGLLFLSFGANAIPRSWYQKAQMGGDARHRGTGFSIGNKGYFGGGHINSGTTINYKDYWEYDPATNSWTQIADYGGGLRYHSSAFTIGNAAYVGCGENSTDDYTNDFWKYVPEVNTWFPVASLPGTPRRGGTAFTINGVGFYGTGQSDEGYHTDFYKYDAELDTWEAIADFPGEPRSASVSFVIGDIAYLGTGHKIGAALNDFYAYDPGTNVWTTKTAVGGPIRQDAMAFSIDGKGYIGTGNDNLGNDFRDIWEYDVSTDTWTQIEDFTGQKRRYAITFVIDDIVYLGGGTDGTNFKDFWAYAPTLSILENELSKVVISTYPNPSTTSINISTHSQSIKALKLYYSITDLNGRTIKHAPFPSTMLTLNKTEFGTGIYLFHLHYNHSIYLSKKIIFN